MPSKLLNKLPSTLSEEELLKQALDPSVQDIPVQEAPNNIVAFLLYYKLEPGAFLVKRDILFTLYTKWTKNYEKKNIFYYEVCKYLPTAQRYGSTYYYINKNSFDIGQKTFNLLRQTEDQNGTKSPKSQKHFKNFMDSLEVKDGNVWISTRVLYKLYTEWCKTKNRKKPLGMSVFNKFLKLFYKKEKLVKQILYIGLNKQVEHAEEENKKEKQS